MTDLLNNIAETANSAFEIREGDYEVDGIIYCGKCNAPRQTRGTGPFEGKILAAACRCEELAAKEAERKKAVAKLRAEVAKSRFYERGYESFTFASDDGGDREAGKICREYAEKFPEMETESFGLFICGPVGTGKSFLAGAVVNALLDNGVSAMICTSSRILSELRSAEKAGKLTDAVDELNRFRFLVLDDFAAEFEDDDRRINSYNIRLMERLINDRMLANRPMCVTTNTSMKKMSEETRMGLERVYDRVIESCCMPVVLDGRKRRTANAAERREACKRILGA